MAEGKDTEIQTGSDSSAQKESPEVTVNLSDRTYSCDKIDLSRHSGYFRDLFGRSSSKAVHVTFPDVTSKAFEVLIWYMHTGELKITSCQDIVDVYTAASNILVNDVKERCVKLVQQKTPKAAFVVTIYIIAHNLGNYEAAGKAMRYMIRNFPKVAEVEEYLDLTANQVRELLSSRKLEVKNEVDVFEAALKWLSADFSSRLNHVESVLSCVRYPLMTLNEVMICCCSSYISAEISRTSAFEEIIFKATNCVLEKEETGRGSLGGFCCQPRKYTNKEKTSNFEPTSTTTTTSFGSYGPEDAASKIQALFRGYLIRKKISTEMTRAKKIQASFRGYMARKRIKLLETPDLYYPSPMLDS